MLNIICIIIIIVFVGKISHPILKKLYMALTFFSEGNIVKNFRSIKSLGLKYRTAKHGQIANFEKTDFKDLPETFVFGDKIFDTKKYLSDHQTTGLVVLKINNPTSATLLFEDYYLGNGPTTKVISWSLNKSFVSALIGIAISEGKIRSIKDFLREYSKKFIGLGYDSTSIKNILQMSSGVSFDENYANTFSDINNLAYNIVLGFNTDNFIYGLEYSGSDNFNYSSADTQVLSMVLRTVVYKSLTEYFEEKLWRKCGFESDCDWLTDKHGNELAFGGLNATTRDYARFGWLYANKGKSPVDESQVISEEWIEKSVKCTKEHLLPIPGEKLGYGYQWWIPGGERSDYMAIGVYGQFIYVDPTNNIVIAKNSADHNYNSYVNENKINMSELEAVNLFRAISDHYTK